MGRARIFLMQARTVGCVDGDNYSKMFFGGIRSSKEIGRRSGFVGVLQTDWGLPGLLKVGASQPLEVSRRPDWPRRCSPRGFELDAS